MFQFNTYEHLLRKLKCILDYIRYCVLSMNLLVNYTLVYSTINKHEYISDSEDLNKLKKLLLSNAWLAIMALNSKYLLSQIQ